MRLLAETWGDCLVIAVDEARIDAAAAVQFKDEVRRMVEAGEGRVVLDMERVDSIDSSGLGAIVAVMKMMGPGRKLDIAAPSPKVRTVFRLTRMDRVLTIHDSRDAALVPVPQAS